MLLVPSANVVVVSDNQIDISDVVVIGDSDNGLSRSSHHKCRKCCLLAGVLFTVSSSLCSLCVCGLVGIIQQGLL